MLVYSLCFAEKPLLMIKVARGNDRFCPNIRQAEELEPQQNEAYRKSSINEGTQTTDFNPYRSTMSSNHSVYTGQSAIYSTLPERFRQKSNNSESSAYLTSAQYSNQYNFSNLPS